MAPQTQVYRKTHTDQILNYNSNHPTQHKISCIKTFSTELTHIVILNRTNIKENSDKTNRTPKRY